MSTAQHNRTAIFWTAVLLLHGSIAAAQTVLYADDFNRPDSFRLGSTSVGSYAWVDYNWENVNFWNEARILSETLRLLGHPNRNSAYAYVDYDLDAVHQYNATFRLSAENSGYAGSTAGLFLLPRTLQATNVVGNSGWVFNRNYYDPYDSSGAYTRIYWYEGEEPNEFGSIPASRLDEDQFLAAAWQDIRISVTGDHATLTVTQDNGATLVDKNRYIGNASSETKSVFMFAIRFSIGQTGEHTIRSNGYFALDDFEVLHIPKTGTAVFVR